MKLYEYGEWIVMGPCDDIFGFVKIDDKLTKIMPFKQLTTDMIYETATEVGFCTFYIEYWVKGQRKSFSNIPKNFREVIERVFLSKRNKYAAE